MIAVDRRIKQLELNRIVMPQFRLRISKSPSLKPAVPIKITQSIAAEYASKLKKAAEILRIFTDFRNNQIERISVVC